MKHHCYALNFLCVGEGAFRLVCLLVAIALAGCSRPSQKATYHAAYFDPVFDKAYMYTTERGPEILRYLDSAYAAFPDPSPLDLAKKYNFKLDYHWLAQRDHVNSRIYIDSILNVLASLKTDPIGAKLYGNALLCLGDIYREEYKFSDAIARYFEGRAYIQQTGDTCFFYEFNARLAMVYYRQQKYNQSIPYFRDAFFSLEACTADPFYKFHYQQGQIDNIGLCYDRLDQPDSALFYYDSALNYIQLHESSMMGIPGREKEPPGF